LQANGLDEAVEVAAAGQAVHGLAQAFLRHVALALGPRNGFLDICPSVEGGLFVLGRETRVREDGALNRKAKMVLD
jgi:hypothetical protein